MDVHVTAGSPTPEELAALTVVVAAVGSAVAAPPRPRRSPWTDPASRLGVGRTWRDSALPR